MALDVGCWQQQLYCPPPAALIGSGRKGRRKGSKNRSFVQRLDERDEKNEIKRQNERQRVKNISQQYNRLRRALGDPHPEKKLRKQQVLDACITYIQQLQNILKNADGVSSCSIESPSCSSGGSISEGGSSFHCSIEEATQSVHNTQSTAENLQDSPSCGTHFKLLQCNESFHTLSTSCPSSPAAADGNTAVESLIINSESYGSSIAFSGCIPAQPNSTTAAPALTTPLYLPAVYYNYPHTAATTNCYTSSSPDITADPHAQCGGTGLRPSPPGTSMIPYHHPYITHSNGQHQHVNTSSFYEWNIGGDVELFDGYNVATFETTLNPSPPKPAQRQGYPPFPPPPLHHMY